MPRPAGTLSRAKPDAQPKESAQLKRAAFYIDGFNLYHAIARLGANHLKWVDLWKLSTALLNPRAEALVKVVWCTAEYRENVQKMLRHREYRKALETVGVTPVLGHFIREPVECPHCRGAIHCERCGDIPHRPTEKEGDVNTAIHLIADAHTDAYDTFYLVSADSDQVATVKLFRAIFPSKTIIVVAPPGQVHSKDVLEHASGNRTISREAVESCLLGQSVTQGGRLVVTRPQEYNPPGSGVRRR